MARCRFGDVVREIKNSIDRENNPYDYYIAGGHMDSEDLHIHRKGSFKTDDVGPAFIREFKKGQVLYGSRRTYLKKVAVADFDGVTANTTFVLETKDENVLLQSLLPFVMLSDSFTEWSIGKSKGSTNPYVLFSDLADYEFELPPIEKQRTLAKLLWGIDSTKCSYKDLIDKTDEVVKSQFIEMFGEPSKSDEAVPLERAFEIRDDLRKPLNDVERSQMKEGQLYPYYGANGQVDTINDYMIDGQALCLAEDCGAYGAGDVTSYIIKGRSWVNNHAHVLFPRKECDIEYANAFFRILDMSEYVSGTTRLKLTQGKMKEIPVVLPPMNEQRTFADIVEQSDKSKFELNEAIKDLDAMYKRIIKDNLG